MFTKFRKRGSPTYQILKIIKLQQCIDLKSAVRPLVKSAVQKVNFLFLNQNICCVYSRGQSLFFLLFLIGKNRHGIGKKGSYFRLGMGPKFGP